MDYALDDALGELPEDEGEEKQHELKEKLGKWIKYGECVTLEYDTETDSLTVVKKS